MCTPAKHTLALAIALGLVTPGSLPAQVVSGEDETLALRLDDVTVTARKREESILDASVTVSVVSADDIERQGIGDIDALATLVPGLSFSRAFGRTSDRPVIRGQSNVLARVQFGVESGTAYFIDGVYYNGDLQSIDFNSLDRVEVIKGPQSALYGRNTYAGAINFITRNPTNEFEGSVKLLAARHDERDVTAFASGPLLQDRLFFRLGARHFEYGGEFVNNLTGKTVGQEETQSVNATLLWHGSEAFDARLGLMYKRDRDGTLPIFLQPAIENNCEPGFRSANFRRAFFPPIRGSGPRISDNPFQYYCGPIRARPDLVALNTEALADGTPDGTAFDGVFSEDLFATLTMNWRWDDWTLTSQTGWRSETRRFGADSDHSDAFVVLIPPGQPVPPGTAPLLMNTTYSEVDEWSQEIRIASPEDARLRWLAGAYYYDYKQDQRALTFDAPRRGNPFGNIDEITNAALFGSVNYRLSERTSVTAELRRQRERKVREERQGLTGELLFQGRETFTATTPRLTLDYRLDDDTLLYGIFARGAKPGGLNGLTGEQIGFVTYAQERSDNFELGLKTFLMDRRVMLNAAVFLIDAKDVQLTTAIPDAAGSTINSVATNQGSARTWGIEIESRAILTEHLSMTASYSLADSEFTRGCDDFEYTLNTGGLLLPAGFDGQECSIRGRQLPIGSKHQMNLGFDYRRLAGAGWEWFLTPNLSYESKKFVQVHNRAFVPSATLLNLRAGVRSWQGWQLTLFGRNLLNEDSPYMATRWFDLRHGFNAFGIPPERLVANGCDINTGTCADVGLPRAFFATLRKGRTYGLEFRYEF